MLAALLVILMAIPVFAFAVLDGRKMVYFVLLVAGIPVSILAPDSLSLGPLGELAPQAAYLLVIAIGLIVAIIPAGKTVAQIVRHFLPLVLFLMYAGGSIVWSLDAVEGVRLLVKLVTPVLMVIAVAYHLQSSRDINRAENCALVCACVVAALALMNYVSNGALDKGSSYWISRGILAAPYMGPANFSFLMSVSALICLARFLQSNSRVGLGLAIFFAIAVLFAFTRISMAALVIAGSLLLFLMSRNSLVRYVVPGVLLIGSMSTVFLSEAIRSRMFYNAQRADVSRAIENTTGFLSLINTSGRLYLWEAALDYFESASSLVGAGLGSVDHWLQKYSGADALHSEYLRLYIDTGMIGLVMFLIAIAQILVFLLRERRRQRTWHRIRERHTAVSAALLVLFCITLLTDNSLNYVSEFGIYVFASLGYVMTARRSQRAADVDKGKRPYFRLGATEGFSASLAGNHGTPKAADSDPGK